MQRYRDSKKNVVIIAHLLCRNEWNFVWQTTQLYLKSYIRKIFGIIKLTLNQHLKFAIFVYIYNKLEKKIIYQESSNNKLENTK